GTAIASAASPVLKVCVVGAGAIGGFLGTRLAAAGEAGVAALARGATLVALRDHGWRLQEGATVLQAPAATASDDPRALGPQDLVIITVKGQALPALAPSLAPLIAADTLVLPAMNGVPWWFSDGITPLGAGPLESVDPGGGIAAAIPARQVIGCVVHASAATAAPGIALPRMGRFRGDLLAAHPLRRLVQAVGQHDHESGLGAHRRDHGPGARR